MRLIVLAIAALAPATTAAAHPLHTSLTQIVFDGSHKNVTISIRAFVDDVSAAASASGLTISDYATRSLKLTDSHRAPLRLTSCGEKRVGELVWLCYKAPVHSRPEDLLVSSTLLFEKYTDQINVVTAVLNTRSRNLLFSRGDGPKRLIASL